MTNGTAVARQGPAQGGAVALVQTSRPQFFAALEGARDLIEPFLPEGVALPRVMAAAWLALQKTPALYRCTEQSVILAVAKIMHWGLEVGETAHLVPFGQDCTAVADYKGLIELMVGSGAVRDAQARCVYANEPFSFEQGLQPRLEHRPSATVEGRGALIGAYVILWLPFNRVRFEYMPLAEIDAIRTRYSKNWKEGACPAWYAKKTVLRQVAKFLPKNPKLRSVFRALSDDAVEEFGSDEVPATFALGPSGPVDDDTPSMPATPPTAPAPAPRAYALSNRPAPGATATPAQRERLAELTEHTAVPDAVREKVEEALRGGALAEKLAETWIVTLEQKIAEATPKPLAATEPAASDELFPAESAGRRAGGDALREG
jgi:recombination protein RecT